MPSKPSSQTVGENVRRLRTSLGMSQRQLAIAAGFSSQGNIARIEAASNDPKTGTIDKLADALNVEPVELFRQRKISRNGH